MFLKIVRYDRSSKVHFIWLFGIKIIVSFSQKDWEIMFQLPWIDCTNHRRGPGRSSCLTTLVGPCLECGKKREPSHREAKPSDTGRPSRSLDACMERPVRCRWLLSGYQDLEAAFSMSAGKVTICSLYAHSIFERYFKTKTVLTRLCGKFFWCLSMIYEHKCNLHQTVFQTGFLFKH